MNRRGHLSSKIPNVKLRPAPAGPRRSTRRNPSPSRDLWEEGDDDGEGDTPLTGGSAADRPWTGLVVTFTGVEAKPALSMLVQDMGGTVESALTVKVTHVVASGTGSPKYLYAVEHRLPVLAPSWISDSHKRWLKGDTLDVPGSVEQHRLQPFLGLKIAVSGIDQLDRRKRLIRHINNAGGVYHKDLDRSCTHLISAFPTRDPKAKTSEKIKWALKEIGDREMQRRRGKRVDGEDIRIVYEEWIWDCVAFSGRWKEEGYDARKPRATGKVKYEDVIDGTAFLPVEEKKPEGEHDDDEPVVVKKRKRENIHNLVGELLSTTTPLERKPTEVELLPAMDADKGSAPPEEELPSRSSVFDRKASVLHASRSTAFAATSGVSGSGLLASATSEPDAEPEHTSKRQRTPSFFSGLRISHAIAEGYEGLENALHQHGATIVTEQERLAGAPVDYVVTRLCSQTRPPMPEVETPPMLVTECWIEACCFRQQLIPSEENLVFRPLDIEHPIRSAESLIVHISGFSTESRAFLRRLLKALGGVLSEKFNRHTTHLLCAEPTGIKYDKAIEWGVPVVSDSWLWTMARSGRIEPAEDHALDKDGKSAGDCVKQEPTPMPQVLVRHTTTPLASSTNANLSTVSGLADSHPDDGPPAVSSLPASRMLKSTPTHVDVKAIPAAASAPLSPANVAERRMHLTRGMDSPGNASHPGSSPRSGPRVAAELKAAATVAAAGGAHGKDEVTAALRRLAEGGAVTSSKVVRRSRPSSNSRQATTATTPLSASTSPVTKTKPEATGFPQAEPAPSPGPEEESIHVTYADAASEKERRRMLDAVMRGGGGSGTSPKRRGRV